MKTEKSSTQPLAEMARLEGTVSGVKSGKSRTLLNNYYGYYSSSLDDMDIDAQGQIWFTNNGT